MEKKRKISVFETLKSVYVCNYTINIWNPLCEHDFKENINIMK